VALNDYKGAVLLITHDVYLAEGVADRLWLVHDGRASPRRRSLRLSRACSQRRSPGGPRRARTPRAAETGVSGEAPERLHAEAALETAQRELQRIEDALLDPELYARDAARAGALANQRAAAEEKLHGPEEEWLAVSAALEAARP
jgi:ATP-binding cassette subfamily F protein 3